MRRRCFWAAALGVALLLSGTASAEEWFDSYGRGLAALKQGEASRAVQFFERSIRLHPEPGRGVITYGTNSLDEYYPYLRLVEAQLLANNVDAARHALRRSEAFGKEPGVERARLARLVQAAATARLAAAAPPLTLPATPPPPTSLAGNPQGVALALPTPAAPLTSPPPSDRDSSGTWASLPLKIAKIPTPARSVATAPPPATLSPATVPSPTPAPSPLAQPDQPPVDQAPAAGGSPRAFALGLFVLVGLAVAAWGFRARKGAASPGPLAVPGREIQTRAITRHGSGPTAAGEAFGAFRLLEPLGKGGMAEVFRAERNGEICALKRPLAAVLDDPEFLVRFLREAEIGRTLHHPNIVRIYERGDVDGIPYFTMELVKGRTLQALIRERGALEPKEAAMVVSQVAEALDYAHLKGVIHRDLKPSNIMTPDDGAVRVMDYGIAWARRFDGLTIAGTFLGTPEYAAPETAQGRPSDARSDLYSLGVVFYETLTGTRPFVGDTPFVTLQKQCTEAPVPPSVAAPQTPRPLEAIVLRLLSKDPADRYPGAEELLIDLRHYLNRAG